MSLYIKLTTNAMNDPKVIAAGPAATILWLRGLAYAKEHMTDGEVSDQALPILAAGLGTPKKLAATLVAVGLWERCKGGHTVGAERWSNHQTTSDEVKQKRERWRAMKRRQRGVSTEDSNEMSARTKRGQGADKQVDNQRGPAPPEHRAQSTEHRAQRGEIPPTPRPAAETPSVVGGEAAVDAIDRWATASRGTGLEAVRNELQRVLDRVQVWGESPPMVYAGSAAAPVVFVPEAVRRVMARKNPPRFKSVAFALGCIDSELDEMRRFGAEPAGVPDGTVRDYSALVAEALAESPETSP